MKKYGYFLLFIFTFSIFGVVKADDLSEACGGAFVIKDATSRLNYLYGLKRHFCEKKSLGYSDNCPYDIAKGVQILLQKMAATIPSTESTIELKKNFTNALIWLLPNSSSDNKIKEELLRKNMDQAETEMGKSFNKVCEATGKYDGEKAKFFFCGALKGFKAGVENFNEFFKPTCRPFNTIDQNGEIIQPLENNDNFEVCSEPVVDAVESMLTKSSSGLPHPTEELKKVSNDTFNQLNSLSSNSGTFKWYWKKTSELEAARKKSLEGIASNYKSLCE